jgi:hypothetical protein
MKLSFLNYKTRTHLKKNKAIRTSLPYKQALSVGLIFTVEDRAKHDVIKDFVRHLEQDGKHVKVISLLPKNKENYEFMFDFFTEKELTFWGNIESSSANKFVDSPFDFLYYLDAEPNPLLLNLIARSKARCRVGKFFEAGTPFFELMIETKNTVKGMIEEMYRYTKVLR